MTALPTKRTRPTKTNGSRELAAALFILTGPAIAQDLLPKAAPEAEPIVLQNATIHTVSDGIVLGGTLWFHDGRIGGVLAKGETPSLPENTNPKVIDLQGAHVYPGFVSAHTTLGLQEIGMVRQSVDVNEIGEFTPEVLASVAVNPDSTAIPVARSNGILAAGVFPSGGAIAGRASVIQLDGWTNADMAVLADAGPVVAWPARSFGSRPRRPSSTDRSRQSPDERTREGREAIARAFREARAWLDARTADPSTPIDIRHRALVPAVRGEAPVFVRANELEQIESAVLWATAASLRPVIVGGRDAIAAADLLREHKVPVILDGVHDLPRREDSPYDARFTLPARLAAAGLDFCIATGDGYSNDRNLPYHVATAIAHGLDRNRAVAAITLHAATILGVGNRLGSLAKGKDATLFVCNGDPFELDTRTTHAFIRGRQVDLRNKQTELAEKYRKRYRDLGGK
ncbi:MAG: amidohydrolase family protein [bacterium]|nr:amidohydrolase family protein [bacterium]